MTRIGPQRHSKKKGEREREREEEEEEGRRRREKKKKKDDCEIGGAGGSVDGRFKSSVMSVTA
jgi:ribosome assembly protein YihI (activator of Der GTPase)